MLQTRALPLAAPIHAAPMFRRQVPHESEFRQLIERWSGYVRATLRKLDQRRSEADERRHRCGPQASGPDR